MSSAELSQDFMIVAADWTVEQAQLMLEDTQVKYVLVRRELDATTMYSWFRLFNFQRTLDDALETQLLADVLDFDSSLIPSIPNANVANYRGPVPVIVLDANGLVAGLLLEARATPTPFSENRDPWPENRAPIFEIPDPVFEIPPSTNNPDDMFESIPPSNMPPDSFESTDNIVKGIPKGGDGPASNTFKAYPKVAVKSHVPFKPFDVLVGFSAKADKAIIGGQQPFEIKNLASNEVCTILIRGFGLSFDRNTATIPFKLAESVKFRATPHQRGRCIIYIDYLRGRQLIGRVERVVVVDDADETPTATPSAPLQLESAPVDLVITLRHNQNMLQWSAIPNDPDLDIVVDEPSPQHLTQDNTKQIALEIIKEAVQKNPVFAASGINSIGSSIYVLVPERIWQVQRDLSAKHQRRLKVLLCTQEVFIPWELALLPEPLAHENAANEPLFWAVQTDFARWIDSDAIAPIPPAQSTITRLSAVAGKYSLASAMDNLENALEEQEFLKKTWKAQPISASSADLAQLLKPTTEAGHLIHFAVHGVSNPSANEQELILTDGQPLTPRTLMGSTLMNPARFSFVFLNACQVATPGTSLGQLSGFPVEVLKSGALGFIAPLWEANDEEAFNFAKLFYSEAFKAQPLAAILQAYRATYNEEATTTRLAYVYYGHPGLILNLAKE